MSDELQKIISEERLGKYLLASSFEPDRALTLYAWNMQISASFFPLFASIEICLRNLILNRVSVVYGEEWWASEAFHHDLGRKGKGIVKRAENAVRDQGKTPESGRITAELTFGFWQKMLLPKYEVVLWAKFADSFPHVPNELSQHDLYEKCEHIRRLRNRISHHEPIFERDISNDYATCITLLRWLSPEKADWLKPHLDTMRLLRSKP